MAECTQAQRVCVDREGGRAGVLRRSSYHLGSTSSKKATRDLEEGASEGLRQNFHVSVCSQREIIVIQNAAPKCLSRHKK